MIKGLVKTGNSLISELPPKWEINQIKRNLLLLTDYDSNGSFSDIKGNVNRVEDNTERYAWFVRTTDLEKYYDGCDLNEFIWIDHKTYNYLRKTKLSTGDLLLAKRGDIGRIYLLPDVNVPTSLAPNLYLARFNQKRILSKFAFYYLLSRFGQFQLQLRNKSTTLGALYKDDFKSIEIIIPPILDQKAIIHYLDQRIGSIEKGISILFEKKNLYNKYLRALVNKAVRTGLDSSVELKESGVSWIGRIPETWDIKRLKDVVNINRKNLNENTRPNYEFRYIDIGNVSKSEDIESIEVIEFKDAPSRARRIVAKGDVIISTVRTYLRAIAVFNFDIKDVIVSTGFAVLSNRKGLNSKYLGYYVKSDLFVNKVIELSTGISYPAINPSTLSRIEITVPPLNEQIEISNYLDEKTATVKLIVENIQMQIDQLKLLKKELINNVVSGQINVNPHE